MIPNVLPKSLQDNPRLDQWVRFEPDRTVTVRSGKIEIGQGILTALTQIAAEELDVPAERVRLVSGETDVTPNEGMTTGSLSIEVSGGAIRLVCAEVRALFVARAAELLGCDPRELSVENGAMLRQGKPTGADYWRLVDDVDLARDAAGNAAVKRPSEFRVVGTDRLRIDLPAKISGAAFIHDMAPDDALHARVIRRPRRGARLGSVDEQAIARAGQGRVRLFREGDFVALLSDDEAAVMAAVEPARRAMDWQGGAAIPDAADQPDFLQKQTAKSRAIDLGEARTTRVTETVEATYSRPYIIHASIAPSCALALYEHGRLTVWTHSQGVFVLRNSLAGALGLPVDDVTVLHRQGAGCYGHNPADDAAFDAALLALRHPGRTVRVQWTREDELASGPVGAAMAIKLRAALDDTKRPAAWTLEVWSGTHNQRPLHPGQLLGAQALPNPPPRPEIVDVPDANGGGATRNAFALYDMPQRVVHHLLPELPVRTSALRGLGAFANVFAIESFIDELAERAGEDPAAYRLSLLGDHRARVVIERATQMANWRERGEKGAGRAKGLGLARYKNRAGYCAVVAEVDVEEEVRLLRVWSAADAGLIINPDGAKNQIEGGIIQAASWTLKEAARIEDGRFVSTTWDDYPILRFSEVPSIDIALIDARDLPPLGIGEIAHGPTAAAIGNAVAHALGARIRDLPLNRERIMGALLAT